MKLKAFAVAAVIAAAAVDVLFIWCFCRIAAKTDKTNEEGEDHEQEE